MLDACQTLVDPVVDQVVESIIAIETTTRHVMRYDMVNQLFSYQGWNNRKNLLGLVAAWV